SFVFFRLCVFSFSVVLSEPCVAYTPCPKTTRHTRQRKNGFSKRGSKHRKTRDLAQKETPPELDSCGE
ncbi:MAG: hypothetical protein AAF456_23285, partial [Planctomycetota bacterium]